LGVCVCWTRAHGSYQKGWLAMGVGSQRHRSARRRDDAKSPNSRQNRCRYKLDLRIRRTMAHSSHQKGRLSVGLGVESARAAWRRHLDKPPQTRKDRRRLRLGDGIRRSLQHRRNQNRRHAVGVPSVLLFPCLTTLYYANHYVPVKRRMEFFCIPGKFP